MTQFHKKIAGEAITLEDLQAFVTRAFEEGFDSTHPVNGGKGVGLYVVETDPEPPKAKCSHCGDQVPVKDNRISSHTYKSQGGPECRGTGRVVVQSC